MSGSVLHRRRAHLSGASGPDIAPPRGNRSAAPSPWAADPLGLADLVFSLKAFIAGMLAYYIALRIGLPRPYWAVITSYIVAQPLAGAVLSKALFRLIGTGIGVLVALFLVPVLVNAPELLVLALALWLALCTYVSLLDRAPRSYVFLLAGYTAAIVGFPSVETPGAIFTIASLRAQEIGIGIAAAALVHGALFPRTVADHLNRRVEEILSDAERWSRDALCVGGAPAELDRDRRRLALDLHELRQLAAHLPFDPARLVPNGKVLLTFQDRLSLLLPLASAIQDRASMLTSMGMMPAPVVRLLDDARAWLLTSYGHPDFQVEGARLVGEARRLEPVVRDDLLWADMVSSSLLDRLAELVEAHMMCRELMDRLVRGLPMTTLQPAGRGIEIGRRHMLHRDHGLAMRGAIVTGLTTVIGCAFWIFTAWPDGASAVVIAAIACALFSHIDDPAPVARQLLYGTAAAVGIGALYAFAILPRVTDFVTLVAVLAPAFLMLGVLMARLRSPAFAVGVILTLPTLIGLNDRYLDDGASFANAALAQLFGASLAITIFGLVRSTGAVRAARRLVRAGWRDLARRTTVRYPPDTSAWVSQMLDRIGLLTPRLLAMGIDPGSPMSDILKDTRIGLAIDELHHYRAESEASEDLVARLVLRRVRNHFLRLTHTGTGEPEPALVRVLDIALGRLGGRGPSARRRTAILSLTSLRRNLAPAALPYVARAARAPATKTAGDGRMANPDAEE